MAQNYYLDTCIWRDYFENRSDRFRPLGDWALALIKKIIAEEGNIIYSDLVEEELLIELSAEKIEDIGEIVPKEMLIKIKSTPEQIKRAEQLARRLQTPRKDTIHMVLAMDNNAILVSRDKHFHEFQRFVAIKKPEDLL